MSSQIEDKRCQKCGYSPTNTPFLIPEESLRIRSLLTSNDCPTEDEENVFRQIVIDGQSEIELLELRIAQTAALLQSLEDSLLRAQSGISSFKSVLNPVRRLPAEVLENIFLRVHGEAVSSDPETYFSRTPNSLDLMASPWVFGRVCRSWNAVVVNTRSLWTRVKVAMNWLEQTPRLASSPNGRALALFLLSKYLARSGALPLVIILDVSQSGYSSSEFATIITALLSSCSHRWEALFLRDPSGISFTTMQLFGPSLPLLKHVHIWAAPGTENRIDFIAPSLTSWSILGNAHILTPSSRLSSQIKIYSSAQVSYSEVLGVVRQLPRLRTLRMRFPSGSVEAVDRVDPPIVLSNLKELMMMNTGRSSSRNWRTFVDSITCPALDTLGLDTPSGSDFVETLESFESRSNFHLKNIDLSATVGAIFKLRNSVNTQSFVVRDSRTGNRSVPSAVKRILSHLSHLPRIEADPEDASTTVTLQTEPPREILFPNLRRLELHLFSFTLLNASDTMDELMSMIISRTAEETSDITPREIFIKAPDVLARGLVAHPFRYELMQRGIKVEILGF